MRKCNSCSSYVLSLNVWILDTAHSDNIEAVYTAARNLLDIVVEEHQNDDRRLGFVIYTCINSHINVTFTEKYSSTENMGNYIHNIKVICDMFHKYNGVQYRNNCIYYMNVRYFDNVSLTKLKDVQRSLSSGHDIYDVLGAIPIVSNKP